MGRMSGLSWSRWAGWGTARRCRQDLQQPSQGSSSPWQLHGQREARPGQGGHTCPVRVINLQQLSSLSQRSSRPAQAWSSLGRSPR